MDRRFSLSPLVTGTVWPFITFQNNPLKINIPPNEIINEGTLWLVISFPIANHKATIMTVAISIRIGAPNELSWVIRTQAIPPAKPTPLPTDRSISPLRIVLLEFLARVGLVQPLKRATIGYLDLLDKSLMWFFELQSNYLFPWTNKKTTLTTHELWHPPWQLSNALTTKRAGFVWTFL